MNRFYFTKLSGAGNDFILFDKKLNPDLQLTPQIIQKLCKRGTGIGADGVLIISDRGGYSFEMNYFNADGSTGSLCANGARCALLYGKESERISSGEVNFLADQLQYSGLVLDDKNVKFFFNPPKRLKYNFKIKAADQLITASFADTGAPHVVIKIKDVLSQPVETHSGKNSADLRSFYNDIEEFPVFELGRQIRYHKDFAPEGTNVNFIDVLDGVIKIRSYERGVEDETLSCGTGSVAAALIAYVNDCLKPPIKLIVKSGNELIVDFKIVNQEVRELSLTGPAEITFKGEFSI